MPYSAAQRSSSKPGVPASLGDLMSAPPRSHPAAPDLAGAVGPRGAVSPSSAASEDTEVTLPATLEGAGDEAHEEAELSAAFSAQDDVRFASYRTAAKLRCLQRQTYLYHIDIWNMIEAFRERGLHGLDPSSKLSEPKVRALLASLYGDLQKRLPPSVANAAASSSSSSAQQSSAGGLSGGGGAGGHPNNFLEAKENLLFSFLWRALRSSPHSDRLRVRTLKAALATLCTGKLMDKLRYLFSQLADEEGHLIRERFALFLRDVMRIPAALGEFSSFEGNEDAEAAAIFGDDGDGGRINVNDFLEAMMSDPGPQCLSWLLVLHRIINSEAVFHPVSCGSCRAQGFHGLRYKSDRGNYHLCQNCFWRGRISDDHASDVFKEYNCFKSSGKSSFKRSLQCIPSEKGAGGHHQRGSGGSSSSRNRIPHLSEEPERQLDLSNLIPAPPGVLLLNGDQQQQQRMVDPLMHRQQDLKGGDVDEHHLIAQYASQIATTSTTEQPSHRHHRHHRHRPPSTSPGRRALSHSKQLVQDLERRNKEIMRDISQLRKQQRDVSAMEQASRGRGAGGGGSPKLMSELTHLRSKKGMLDDRLAELQGTREDLMTELEELMKLLHSSSKATVQPDLTLSTGGGGGVARYGTYERQQAFGMGGQYGGSGAAGGAYDDGAGALADLDSLYPPENSLPSLSDE